MNGDVTDAAGLTIEQVSALLGLPAPTIRSWERRHGVPDVSRTSGGHRRYTSEQVDLLRQFRDLIADGRRPGEAAEQLRSQPQAQTEALIEAFYRPLLDKGLEAARAAFHARGLAKADEAGRLAT